MDWLLNHPLVLLFIAIAVANLVQKAKRAGAQQQQQTRAPDPDAAERTRRVQAEIRRKIAERAARTLAEPPPVSTPTAVEAGSPPRSRNVFQELARQMAEAQKLAESRESGQAAAEAQAQQRVADEQKARELAEARQMAEVQRTLQKQQQTVATPADYDPADQKTTTISARDRLLADLREPDSLRRALVLREILGEPVGLR